MKNGLLVEIVDSSSHPPRAYYWTADTPDRDLQDLKLLMRAEMMRTEGKAMPLSPLELLEHLPAVQPMAVGGFLEPIGTDEASQGRWRLRGDMTFQDLPKFNLNIEFLPISITNWLRFRGATSAATVKPEPPKTRS